MLPRPASRSCIAIALLLPIAVLLQACATNSTPPTSPPQVPCEQPQALLPPPVPTGASCPLLPLEARRSCIKAEQEAWDVAMLRLYAAEVNHRAREDRCLRELRDRGVIR